VAGVVAASVLPGSLCYEARLPDGGRDSGRASVLVGRSILNDGSLFGQIEVFTSDPTVDCGFAPEEPPPPPPVGPLSKDDCKNGGF